MKRIVLVVLALVLLVAVPAIAGLSFVALQVFNGSYEQFDKKKIVDILSRETIVYYADGQTQLGSLFGQEHRQYVDFREMPKHLLDAVVAAEDDSFYEHFGIDFKGLARAAFRTYVIGHKEGASTITQQTVKNLFGREKTNLVTKFKEIINALKLERKFKKQEILEFYLNQFHVTGNGRGAGIAAKYYFDKDVGELSLTEAAFIAGSVKNPEKYNPFKRRTLEGQKQAKSNAKDRKNYVLRRMLENNFITKAEFNGAKNEDVPFRQGRFQFNELFVTELVRRQLSRPEILGALGLDNVDTIGTKGYRITTTLEEPVQVASQYGVRQNLSRLEMILTGFKKETPDGFRNIQRPEKYAFYVAEIKSIDRTPKKERIVVSLGVPECEAPTDAIERVAKITDQALYKGLEKSKQAFLGSLALKDHVLVSVRDISADGQKLTCDIERKPRIQGGLLVLDKGKIVSMVGGYSPYEYNRAVFARRQPGSTFKSLTFYAAMQLGWNALEPLPNVRNVYTWQNQFYYPRPDHAPETLETDIAGAGAKSENLASIWLLSRLTQKLTFDQFRDVLKLLGIYNEGENESDFLARIGRTFNVRLLEDNLRAGIMQNVTNEMTSDVMVSQDKTLRVVLRTMHYGKGFDAEFNRVLSGRGGLTAKERAIRVNILRNSFERWDRVAREAQTAIERLKELAGAVGGPPSPAERTILDRFRTVNDRLVYLSTDAFLPEIASPLLSPVGAQFRSAEDLISLVRGNTQLTAETNVWLDGVLSLSMFHEIQNAVNEKFAQVAQAPLLEKLFWHDDFKYSLGMYYARKLVQDMGIESDLQWVPSFPLGVNDVSLAELALAYQTILNGKLYRYFKSGPDNQILLIKRIEDAQGNLMWEADSDAYQLVDEAYTSPMMSVLRGTVTNGSARSANNAIVLRSKEDGADKELLKSQIRVPSFGKTGTTNNWINATYIGFLPYPTESDARELSPDHAYTIASYVGYDTNEPMRRHGFKVFGGTGALPAWIETANALIREEDFAGKIGWRKLAEAKIHEVPFHYDDATTRVSVPLHGGAYVAEAKDDDDGQPQADLNKFIDDYAVSAKSSVTLHLPGKMDGGLFSPSTRVAFFHDKAASKAGGAAAAHPAGSANAANAPAGATNNAGRGNLPPTPFVAPKFNEEDPGSITPEDEEQVLAIPPAPPGLGGGAPGNQPAQPLQPTR